MKNMNNKVIEQKKDTLKHLVKIQMINNNKIIRNKKIK